MNKKGFTLTELMGIIIILGVILLLTMPAVDKIINNAKETSYLTQIEKIKNAANDWSLKNVKLLPKNNDESIVIYLSMLKSSGLIDMNIKNPKTNKIMSNNTSITITNKDNKYLFDVNIVDIDFNQDDNVPILIIDGSVVDYVEVNQTGDIYEIPSAKAQTFDGKPIDDSYISYQIIKDDVVVSGVDTSQISTYKIIYSITYANKTANYEKLVEVRDTTSPIIIVGDPIKLNSDNISFNALEGVSVTDNSGEQIIPIVKNNVSNVPGNYYIYYEATDSSGNTSTKRRQVIVNK